MTGEVPEILRLYLNHHIDFDSLEDRLLPFALDSQREDERDMVDLVFAEFYCVRDGTSSEPLFRKRLAQLIAPEPNRAPATPSKANAI